jgi:hypothetical protein
MSHKVNIIEGCLYRWWVYENIIIGLKNKVWWNKVCLNQT